ncbi:Ankyrin repeat [Poseidonocella pacifica]|uniref:Ankyrin repeat n=1 Tax=Poseidonocella pacifica TaxID=871651 RepID=A0A1I0WSX9_9RHOB|nr:hypothetical protein [Poseidonocella pacifica]SFA91869.1 Ankyrin repeat [Poseidonocella pacifica]
MTTLKNALSAIFIFISASTAYAELYCYQPENPGWDWTNIDFISFSECLDNGALHKREIDGKGKNGMSLLEAALSGGAKPSVIGLILAQGADPNQELSNRFLNLPLQLASIHAHLDKNHSLHTMKVLLEAGADPNLVSKNGLTAFHGAFMGRDAQITMEKLDLIIEYGADFSITSRNQTGWILPAISANASLDILKKIDSISDADYSETSVFGKSPGQTLLHHLARETTPDAQKIAVWLISKGTDPKAVNSKGEYAWELVEEDIQLRSQLKVAAGMGSGTGLSIIASDNDIQKACRSPKSQAMYKGDGVTVDEICSCVEDYAETRYSRISQHPRFSKVYGSRNRQGQIDELVRGLVFGCMGIWSYTP